MSLERMLLLLLLKNGRQFDEIKKHLLGSVRELILALSSSLNILKQSSEEAKLNANSPLVTSFFQKAEFLLDFSLEHLPQPQNQSALNLEQFKNNLISSIIDIIDEEMENLDLCADKNSHFQKQALQAIKQAFLTRLSDSEDDQDLSYDTDEDLAVHKTAQS